MAGPRFLCRIEEIPDRTARGFTVGAGAGERDILVYRDGAKVHGFANSCPHIGSPLDWAPDRFMALDGLHLACATHGALFRPVDGYCVSGPCQGESLAALPVRAIDGRVIYEDE